MGRTTCHLATSKWPQCEGRHKAFCHREGQDTMKCTNGDNGVLFSPSSLFSKALMLLHLAVQTKVIEVVVQRGKKKRFREMLKFFLTLTLWHM